MIANWMQNIWRNWVKRVDGRKAASMTGRIEAEEEEEEE